MARKFLAKVIKEKKKEHAPFAFRVTMGIICVDENDSVQHVARVLAKHKIGAVIVKSAGAMAGIISERDIAYKVVALGKCIEDTLAKDIMTKEVVTINLLDGLKEIYEQMKKIPFRHLPVRKGDEIVGMVSNRDLMYLRRLRTIRYKK